MHGNAWPHVRDGLDKTSLWKQQTRPYVRVWGLNLRHVLTTDTTSGLAQGTIDRKMAFCEDRCGLKDDRMFTPFFETFAVPGDDVHGMSSAPAVQLYTFYFLLYIFFSVIDLRYIW